MDTMSLRNMILSTPLQEQPVTIAAWPGSNLLIRELDGKAGSDLMASVTIDNEVDQDALVFGIFIATLRNADDPNKALVFCMDPETAPNTPNPAFHDSLMATGLGNIMQVANASIRLSGLDMAAAKDTAKNASAGTPGATSPIPSPSS